MGRVPIEAGYFTIPDAPGIAPRLLGSRCPACGEHLFPRRVVCARCLHEGCEDVELGPEGTLHTWTYVHVPRFGDRSRQGGGYGVGQVDLPEGPRVQAVLLGDRDAFAIGMALRLDLEVLRTTDDGDEVVTFRFAPVAAAPEAATA